MNMKGVKYTAVLDSFNNLDVAQYCCGVESDLSDPDTPVSFKRNLRLDELDKQLFPVLVTGVRWWPFLAMAMRCETEQDEKSIYKASKKLSDGRRAIGPQTKGTLRPYLSMSGKIKDDDSFGELRRFLESIAFDGAPRFFTAYGRESRWKKALLSANGKPAQAYLKAHRVVKKEVKRDPEVSDVISEILGNKYDLYNNTLWHGAFSYAMVRCLYGYYDSDTGKVEGNEYLGKWQKLLVEILKSPPICLPKAACNPRYIDLLHQIDVAEPIPPLRAQTKRFREAGRPVLASLRISLFHNLYFNPRPAGM